MINVAVMGYGTVGSGVVELLHVNHDRIARSAGDSVRVKYILDVRDFEDSPYAGLFVKDFAVIENDPEVSVVVETIGGVGVAQEFTRRALAAGKSVVTSNKELVSEHGCELLKIAGEHNVCYLFEASVGGGVPILHPISACLAADDIDEIYGILNGTTNYILTNMFKNGATFDKALGEAQEKGYAERDPSADINGVDTCRKTCILADIAFGRNIAPKYVRTEGIANVSAIDVEHVSTAGASIKLIGRTVRMPDGTIASYTAPHVLTSENLLVNVEGVFNGIVVRGDATGETMFYGKGAGKLPTATAVIADIIETGKTIGTGAFLGWSEAGEEVIGDPDLLESRWYIRANMDFDEAAVRFGQITMLGCDENGAAFITGSMTGIRCAELLEDIEAITVYRVLE
ncbi:MAG: homoserine dehydrogenase [Clostridiales bacterium]|nr:homoserine dehydrogenase [Clostridiales bacterium]